jgi:hypothetical protein
MWFSGKSLAINFSEIDSYIRLSKDTFEETFSDVGSIVSRDLMSYEYRNNRY